MIIFNEKRCYKGDIVLSLSITNSLPDSLEPMNILGSLVFSNY